MTVEYWTVDQIALRLWALAKAHPECADLAQTDVGVTGATDEEDWKPMLTGHDARLNAEALARLDRVAREMKATVRLRPKRTSKQLGELAMKELGVPGTAMIHRDADLGFRATLLTGAAPLAQLQPLMDQVIERLRARYQLKD